MFDYKVTIFACTMVLFVMLFLQVDYARHLADKVLIANMQQNKLTGSQVPKQVSTVDVFAVIIIQENQGGSSEITVPTSSLRGEFANSKTWTIQITNDASIRLFDRLEREPDGDKAKYVSCNGRTYLYQSHDRLGKTIRVWDLSTITVPSKQITSFGNFENNDGISANQTNHLLVYTVS